MKIMNREQFMKMPCGTVYENIEYDNERCGLEVKISDADDLHHEKEPDENGFWGLNDYESMSLVNAFVKRERGNLDYNDNGISRFIGTDKSFSYEQISQRDACYEEDDLFCVWEKEDIEQLINTLQESLEMIEEKS